MMDTHGDILNDGFNGNPVSFGNDANGVWVYAGSLLLAGPFPSRTQARSWLSCPESRSDASLWCVRI